MEIIVHTQKQFDKIKVEYKGDDWRYIYIQDTKETIIVNKQYENSSVVAWEIHQ